MEVGRERDSSSETLETLATYAERQYTAALRRVAKFPQLSMGDPSWFVLLTTFAYQVRRRPAWISNIAEGSTAPMSTALRHIGVLIESGLVSKVSDHTDKRRSQLLLTAEGKRLVVDALSAELRITVGATAHVSGAEPFFESEEARMDMSRLHAITETIEALQRDVKVIADRLRERELVAGRILKTHTN